MEGKKEGPENPGKTQLEEIREMLGHILQRQTEDRQTAEQNRKTNQENKERLDEILRQQARDKKDILQRLDRAEQQTAEMQTTLQQTVTAQNAQILQIQSDHAKTTQQVRSLVNQHEQLRTEAKNTKESMATLEAGVNEMRHEQRKLKDNERTCKEIHGQMLALTDEVAKLREAHTTHSKATTAMGIKFRNEQEKLHNNEKSQTDTIRRDFERSFHELRANLERLHTEIESLKIGVREERTKMEEHLRQEIEHMIEAESKGNTTFDQSMEENLADSTVQIHQLYENLADSTVKIHQLRKEFEQFKNNQFEEHIGQQTNSPVGQIVEKLGQMVEQQTGFFGTILPQLLEQQTVRPLLMQTFEQREIEDDSNQAKSAIPTAISASTKEPSNPARVLSHLTQSNTASVRTNASYKGDSSNPQQQKLSGVSGAIADVLGLQVNTMPPETRKQTTITPEFYYSRDDADKLNILVDLFLPSTESDGNVIIIVNGDHRLSLLQEFLHRKGLDSFSKYQPFSTGILLVTMQDMVDITGIITKYKAHKEHYLWDAFFEKVTAVFNYDAPHDLVNYKWSITEGMDLSFTKKDVRYVSIVSYSNQELCFGLLKLLTDSRTLEALRMNPRPDVPSWLEVVASPPKFKHNGGGFSQHTRPASGSREFRSNFNARTVGDSPKAISDPSAREYIGMRPGDWKCSDCSGWVWRWKTECDSFTCQSRRQEKGISESEMVSSPSRPKERELSVPCSPAATKRTVSFAVDDEEDSRGPTGISPVANERSEMSTFHVVLPW